MHHILQEFRHRTSVDVDAPPDAVWALVTDIERMGEWSPICRRCEWLGDHREATVGAPFKGTNRVW